MKTQAAPSANSPRTHIPHSITLHEASATLQLEYANGTSWHLPLEFLRVFSPSAEVQGHAPDERILQTGKRDVKISAIETVGNYAIQPTFSDGHNSGIYTWEYLWRLGENQQTLWQQYLNELSAAGLDRDTPMKNKNAENTGGCGSGSCGCQ